MNLVELFEKYRYICCDNRQEEYELYKEVFDYGLKISDEIDNGFIDELMACREFQSTVIYPVVYILNMNEITTTSSQYYDANKTFNAIRQPHAAVEVDDLI